jgi:hypothetical protein
MKNLIILIIAFLSQHESYCQPQTESQTQTICKPHVTDTLTQSKFNDYVDLILSSKMDTIIQVGSTSRYRINYVTSHGFNFPQDFHDSLYMDSLHIICISNPKKIQDSIIRLNLLDTDTSYISYTQLWKGKSAVMKVFTFRKLNPNAGELDNRSASFIFDAEVSRILSFNSGQFLVISETYFEPDIRSSMPPGYIVTLFLEVVK